LSVWLNSSPNFEEVSKWYVGWKSLFNEKILQHPNIKTKLSYALAMMNRSVSGAQVSYSHYANLPAPAQAQTVEQPNISAESIEAMRVFIIFKNLSLFS
jgi:hypothetical protein